MNRPRYAVLLLVALNVSGLVASTQAAPNPFEANAQLPGFAPAGAGTTILQPSAYSKPSASDIPPPPPPPAPAVPAVQSPMTPKGGAAAPMHKLVGSTHLPGSGFPAPSMPPVPPAPAVLPSVGEPTGPSDLIDPSKLKDGTVPVAGNRIETHAGETKVYLIKVSSTAPNLIQSPFSNPRILTTSNSSVQFKAHGRNLVLSVTQAGPVGVYITGESPEDPMVGLVLDPAPIPPRSYSLDIAGYSPSSKAAQGNETYVQSVVDLMRSVVEGKIPPDFTQVGKDRLPGDQMFMGVRLHPVRQYVSPNKTILVLLAKNENIHPQRLVENDFYSKGVVGVVIDPVHDLKPGEVTHVYILSAQAKSNTALLGVWHGSGATNDGGMFSATDAGE